LNKIISLFRLLRQCRETTDCQPSERNAIVVVRFWLKIMDKLKLEPTAALVMQWSLRLFKKEDDTFRFIQRLDLSSGNALYNKCHSVCPWYDEIILNRKHFIRHLIELELQAAKEEYQLVILAAGKSPLSIQILRKYTLKIQRVLEVDLSKMEEKERLYREIVPEFQPKIRCIDADIVSPDIIPILSRPENGFQTGLPAIVVLEGISYYLKKRDLQNIISRFKSDAKCIFILEYLVSSHLVAPARRSIPEKIFGIIREVCELEDITSYTRKELRSLFQASGGDLWAGYSMVDMEMARTGRNTYFKKRDDSWIECVIGRFPEEQNRSGGP
jgi:O-methyltransferase involved in polyketide biosynthesis